MPSIGEENHLSTHHYNISFQYPHQEAIQFSYIKNATVQVLTSESNSEPPAL